jgi:hypothetical protein
MTVTNNLAYYDGELMKNKSAAIFCHQVVVWVLDLFYNFYFLKNDTNTHNSKTTEARNK